MLQPVSEYFSGLVGGPQYTGQNNENQWADSRVTFVHIPATMFDTNRHVSACVSCVHRVQCLQLNGVPIPAARFITHQED